MPDWLELVKSRLGPLGLDPQREAEIIAEFAAHLDELHRDFLVRGCSEEESVDHALASVSDWSSFRRDIRVAEIKGGAMNQRVRSVWLPGLFAVAVCYAVMRFLAFLSVMYGTHLKSLLVVALATYVFGFVAAGGGASYLSRRMGGGVRHHVLSALFPVGVWVVIGLYGVAKFALLRAAHPDMKFELLLFSVSLMTAIIALPLLIGVFLVKLQSTRSNRAGSGPHSGSVAGGRRQVAGGLLDRWLHRFRLSHA